MKPRFPNPCLSAAIAGLMWAIVPIALPSNYRAQAQTNSPTTTPAPAPAAPQTGDAIVQKMQGQWVTKEPIAGDMVMFVFAPNGKGYLISGESPDGKPLSREIQYRVDATTRPMHIDFVLSPDSTVATVFEFTPDNDFRVQILDTAPGKPRPTALSEDATVFQKMSDSTTLPPNTVPIKGR